MSPKEKIAQNMIIDYYKKQYGMVADSKDKNINNFIIDEIGRNKGKLEKIYLERNVKLNKKYYILDYGCGIGNFLFYMKDLGYKIDGYEIDLRLKKILDCIQKSNEKYQLRGKILYSNNGVVPVENNYYDLVFSYFVIEHVRNLEDYFTNAIRVLRPGGKFFVTTCNYKVGYEYHYRKLLPLFSKSLSKILLKMSGRNINFFNSLNFVTPNKIDKCLKKLKGNGLKFTITDIGKENFYSDLSNESIHSKSFINIFKVINYLGLVNVFMKWGFYNPLVYLITK